MGFELLTEHAFELITAVIAIAIAVVIIIFFSFEGGSFRVLEPLLAFWRPAIVAGG